MSLKNIWKTNKLYRYLVISIVPIAILSMDDIGGGSTVLSIYKFITGALFITAPLFLIIWTIILLKKQESSDTNVVNLQASSSSFPARDTAINKNLIREFSRMFWHPHDTLEKNRVITIKQALQGLFLLSIFPSLGMVFLDGLKAGGRMYVFSLFFR